MRNLLTTPQHVRAVTPLTLTAALAMTAVIGCTFEDGDPWGRLDIQASASIDTAGRLTTDGLLRTNRDYRVEVLELSIAATRLVVSHQPPGQAIGFDPARPPEGYTLCHNGHCHATDGRLVDYEDIILELTGGAPQGIERTAAFEPGYVTLGTEAVPLVTTGCAPDCELPRGELVSARLELASWSATLRVTDSLSGDAARLPPAGLLLELDSAVPAGTGSGGTGSDSAEPLAATAPLEVRVDHGERPTIHLNTALVVPATVFDNLDFAAWLVPDEEPDTAAARDALQERMREVIRLSIAVSRSNDRL